MPPGRYGVSAIPPTAASGGNSSAIQESTAQPRDGAADSVGTYLPVYFPGTIDAAGAGAIDLLPGANFTGVDLVLVETRSVRIRGQAIDGQSGQPARGASITLVPQRAIADGAAGLRNNVSAPGFFEFRNVAPGSYEIFATARSGALAITGALPIEVGSADVDNVSLVLSTGFNITGRVVVEGRSGENDYALASAGVRLQSLTPQLSTGLSRVGANGVFELTGVTPGDYRLQAPGLPRNFCIKMARFGSTDILAGPLRVDGPPRGQFDILISPGAAVLDAVAVDEKQQPASSVMVVAVPDPGRRENFDLYHIAATDASGHVHLDGIAPGDYRVFAWEEVENGAWQNSDFLRMYEDRGTPVHIDEGASGSVVVRVIPPGL